MKITSSAFDHEGIIPAQYTCDGENVSPPLSFHDIPDGTIALALLMDDPDVPKEVRQDGVWDHWVVFNIPPSTTEVAENTAPEGGVEGVNTGGKNAYGGPCPPDREHRYFFRLYALDSMLHLMPTAGKADVLKAMEGHVIEEAVLMGRYNRPQNQ